MNIKRPLILVSNDDGYHAKGINCLVDMLRDMADIVVCAPESAARVLPQLSQPQCLCV